MTRMRRLTSETFRSLHVRNFRLFFGGPLISQIGNWLTLVAQALLVLKLTDSGVALGLLAVADTPTAVDWYKRALGATLLWSLGAVAGLEIAGAPFS